MSLTHAILTSLLEKPCSGAALARRFDKSLGYFWQATHQQIYRELAKMEAAGLVQAHGLPTSRGQQRHFEVLAEGRAELALWCGAEGELRPIRDALLVRMRAAAVLDTTASAAAARAEMLRQRALHEQVLARYRQIADQDFGVGAGAGGGSRRTAAQELQFAVLQAGIAYEQSWLAWCWQALADLGWSSDWQNPALPPGP